MLEQFTGKPFVKPPAGKILQSSWVESGENPTNVQVVVFKKRSVKILNVPPNETDLCRGAARLFRLR